MQKPRLSFWQIWNMSFGFLGIQFGWGLQLANMSPIYKYLHAEESQLPYLWLAGPITGLIIQPIIGSMSDRTWNRLGRRRPCDQPRHAEQVLPRGPVIRREELTGTHRPKEFHRWPYEGDHDADGDEHGQCAAEE